MITKTKDMYPQCDIGDYTYGFLSIEGSGHIKIGKFCSIANGVQLVMEGHNPSWLTTYPFPAPVMNEEWPEAKHIPGHPVRGSIKIGNDVWIGKNATIIASVEIGDGAIIAAGSVVTSNVPSYSIYGGVPAKIIRYRFPKHIQGILEVICWWDWDIEKIKRNIHLLCSNDYNTLVSHYTGGKFD